MHSEFRFFIRRTTSYASFRSLILQANLFAFEKFPCAEPFNFKTLTFSFMDITSRNNQIVITSDKKEIIFESPTSIVLDSMTIDFFGEYEKSGFLVTYHEVEGKSLFTLRVEGKNIAYIPTDTLEITEKVVDFLGNIDVLILPGNKNSTKIFENVEARMVVPYGEETPIFLTSLGQNIEMVDKYRTKEVDFESESTVFIRVGN